MIFKTKRLRIRLLKMSDLDDFHLLQSDPEVMRYVDGQIMTYAQNKADLQNIISNYKSSENTFLIWGVELIDTTFIGTCAFIKNSQQEHEIGYRFIKKYWDNGYGKELVKELINYTLSINNITKIYAYVAVDNSASIKILETYSTLESEYWNKEENCWERKYIIEEMP